jgi:hypothetical protein
VRITPEFDPNPLLQMAAAEELMFDPVHPLPEKPKRKRKTKPQPAVEWLDSSEAWQRRFQSVGQPTEIRLPDLKLPDFWPVAEVPVNKPQPAPPQPSPPTPAKPRVERRPMPDTFQLLVYRPPTADQPPLDAYPSLTETSTIVVSAPEPTPPAPKHLAARRQRQRFTWESPEMYVEEE